ncbi:MAG: aminoacyl-tRNA hydrolase [Alphaproteobacteria bacterium]|nr:aminoacyl-tRNA hydrolase [Alphaproteobacteria bacterium]
MLLLVGLGNPGPEYADTRHNVGFRVIDEIVARHGFEPWRSRFHGLISKGKVDGVEALALKPMTFMNNSGVSVSEAARFHKIDKGDIVVFHDEIDLAPGKLKAKRGGGSAGHNGLKSLEGHLGADFRRVRIGVGHPGERGRVVGYLTNARFDDEDEKWLEPLVDAMVDSIALLQGENGDARFTNKVALLTKPPKAKKDSDDEDDA